MIDSLGDLAVKTHVMLNKEVIKETPLLLAIGSHQVGDEELSARGDKVGTHAAQLMSP